ncbi:HAD family hydrolase [Catenovulum sp. 2E275]|uniref:HAD family hydrolase n=1 Tax=Catenovulum sp. 2E275 TaxID=2980497 RepID=UPI0021CEA3CE|nr:HAD family hydrolase [Catenovulum sp. 2E275]MCU4677556.1 HAD family hydrolase [Catenovulum sp. 2E275]
MTKLEAIIFDLDDTLIETKIVDAKAFEQTLTVLLDVIKPAKGHCYEQVFDFFISVATNLFEQSEHLAYFNSVGISPMELLLVKKDWLEGVPFKGFVLGFQKNVWTEVLEKVHSEPGSFPIESIAELFQRSWFLNCQKKEGVSATLNTLVGRFKLAILSNGFNPLQRHKISICGLNGYFEQILISSELHVGKPDPLLFETLLENLGVNASNAVMIGDNPVKDIQGALAVGCQAYLINPAVNDVNLMPYKVKEFKHLKFILGKDEKCKM